MARPESIRPPPHRHAGPHATPAPLPLPGADATIAAVASPPGRGAIATIRVSGPAAHAVAARVLRPWRVEPRAAYRAALSDPVTGELIDRPVVVVYAAPRSYTGEDLVEISTHGGAVVPALALSALVAAGAREALPGEFTRRAVANGKLDLLQAEAIGDLIDARSRAMHGAAVAQLDGALSARLTSLRDAVLGLEALVAYDIDFPEEDDGPVRPARVQAAAGELLAALDALLATADTGELVREGATVVIAGVPNAGKSSLFNALLGYARAIVTEVPGTTRDALEATVDIERWPVRLVDTAGLRATEDMVERLGIEVSERYLARADVVLACGDGPRALAEAVRWARGATAAPVIAVHTKVDLLKADAFAGGDHIGRAAEPTGGGGAAAVSGGPVAAAEPTVTDGVGAVAVSAVTGAGLGALTRTLARTLEAAHGTLTLGAPEAPLLTRERHRRAVEAARREVAEFAQTWAEGLLPPPVAAVHVRSAAAAVEGIIGVVDVEDVL